MKKILIIILTMASFISSAQSIWVTGYVFSHENNRVSPVPFATIKWCDPTDPNEIRYIRFTDMSGHYDLGQNVPAENYYVEISAPGYKTKRKVIGNLPERTEGNITLHFELKPDHSTSPKLSSYSAKEVCSSCSNAMDLLSQIPNLHKDGKNNILNSKGQGIRLLLNGFEISPESFEKFNLIPVELIDRVIFYDFSHLERMIYGGALNIILSEGPMGGGDLDFVPIENNQFTIKTIE